MVIETLIPATPRIEAGPEDDILGRITAGLKALKARNKHVQKYKNYYAGAQPLTYTSETYRDYFAQMVSQYAENVCPAVVDAITDRLQITGTSISTSDAPGEAPPLKEPGINEAPAPTPEELAASQVWSIWKHNRMAWRAGVVHKEASKTGDAFVIVWPDPLTNEPRIYPQDSNALHVHYDPETELIDWAIKVWVEDDKTARCTYYDATQILRFAGREKVRTGDGLPAEKTRWVPVADDAVIVNTYGRVPIFHFANDADIGMYGSSDLRDVLPIQDALNKACADMLVAGEFMSYPQRWATGLIVENDPTTGRPLGTMRPGMDRMLTAGDAEAKFGQFEAANLDSMIAVQLRFKGAAADVVGIPAHYMMMTVSSWPSGESLKTAEARFVHKITDRQAAFGSIWEDVLEFCALIAGISLPGQLDIIWSDASPRSEIDAATVATLKAQLGVSNEQLQRELGYTEEQIAMMGAEADAAAEKEADRMAQNLNTPPFGE